MAVNNIHISVLIEDTKNLARPKLQSKHGLSFFINATIADKEVNVLMDTGPSPEMLLHNTYEMQINLEKVDTIVLSHSHYDHTGGLIECLKKIERRIPIIGHPTLFDPKLSLMPHLRVIGAPFRISDIETVGGVPLLTKTPVRISDGITTTGEVPRTTNFETVRGFWTIKNASLVDDLILDDQSLIIDVKTKGLVVISGCAHSGIINTLKYAQKIAENNEIYAVLGGFHLTNADESTIQATVNELQKVDPEVVAPCHCTGKNAVKKITEAFGDQCQNLHTGTLIDL